ncbi:adenosylmethionine--8-amino-7-oxononanoate transaminase [Phyllobacterium chamaecytisi]|uniref:adenosylmethionine--8-amino-7-oxononanoate transaminase n=1 Tax=Phyllobacterium chamaecytisi TaxID=2876082 RepID=UPI001CCC312A|nr:adenosylmethionine--8-amino-7-oxononanoate transaminase [Phyllobacterium sp. KW56]
MTRSAVWHPFTQHALEPTMKRIVRTDGAYLFDEQGHAILDAISSWWVITHGHRHPLITDAICKASEIYDQIIFAEYTHEPAEELATSLIAVAPASLGHVFYSDSGSTCVEVALKMAFGFFHNRGTPRFRIVVMEYGYHGDTIGTMSAGERGVFNMAYEPMLFDVDRLPFPAPGREQDTLDAFEAFCQGGQVAALLIEPLVLGAGGMLMYPASLLAELRAIATKHGSLMIADEVMTGWGRTGTLFACEQANIAPDILCTSKGLTGGSLPLAATLCSAEIFDAHLSTDRSRTFFHSSSYTANPIACAAALANLDVWKTEPVATRIQSLVAMHGARLERFKADARFGNVRQAGTIVALDVNVPATGYLSNAGPKLRAFFKERNLLIRPLGNVIYLMTPYCVMANDLDRIYDAIDKAADMIAQGGDL